MKEYRLGKNTTEHYTSLQELGAAWGCKPFTKRTKDEKKLEGQRSAFNGKHRCKSCNQPMVWVNGTSVMSCKNPSCKGIKNVRTDADGNEIVTYLPSYDLLDSIGAEIANNLFS